MTDRAFIVFGALVLLSVVVLSAVLYALPRQGLEGALRVRSYRVAPEQVADGTAAPAIPSRRIPPERVDRPSFPLGYSGRAPNAFWIRPFGLHRAGSEGIGWYATSFGILLISSFIIGFVFPGRLRIMSTSLRRHPRRALVFCLVGIVAYALLALLVMLLFLNYTTASLIFLLTPAVLLATLLGLVAVELWMGQLVTRWARVSNSTALMDLLVGVVLLFLIGSIPYAGWAAVGLAAAVGFGALLYTRFGTDEDWNLEALEI